MLKNYLIEVSFIYSLLRPHFNSEIIVVRSGTSSLCYWYHVTQCNPASWTSCRRLNRLPHQPCAGKEGGMSPSRTKNKTCQRADELLRSQWPACNHKQQWQHTYGTRLAIEKMKRTTNHCTRVSAPATSRDPDSNPIPNVYDGNPPNPDGRAFPDRGESGLKVH